MDDFMNQAVTVSVITYNSSKFVLETLESIKAQTYKNLILRICDDCSTDNTVAICREWMEKNKSRFVQTDIIVPDHNTGVSANCNRAWDACTTKYMKSIAGDDVLLPNCIEDNMGYVKDNPNVGFAFSNMQSIGCGSELSVWLSVAARDFFGRDLEERYNRLMEKCICPPAPACFVNMELVRRSGLRHDERIPMIEDLPKWINAIRLGITFGYFDKESVVYRVHDASLSSSSMMNPKYEQSLILFWFYYQFVPKFDMDRDSAIHSAADKMMSYYMKYYNEVKTIRMSRRFRLLMSILKPFDKLVFFVRSLSVKAL